MRRSAPSIPDAFTPQSREIVVYDGARNITQIGQDTYGYDAEMRLTSARINSSQQGVVDLVQSYDIFGNMTAQTATQSGSFASALPTGMVFSGRSYGSNSTNLNRSNDRGFTYDLNGNLKDEPAHDGLSAKSYSFTPDSQLARITPGRNDSHPGTPLQSALYEGGGHRWFRSVWTEGSKALMTLRDASGQVVADYMESNASSGLKLQREYVGSFLKHVDPMTRLEK